MVLFVSEMEDFTTRYFKASGWICFSGLRLSLGEPRIVRFDSEGRLHLQDVVDNVCEVQCTAH